MTRTLAVIGLLTFGLPPAAALAKAPEGGKTAPQHGSATTQKTSTDAAQDGAATAGAHAAAREAKAADTKAAATHKAADRAKTTPHRKTTSHTAKTATRKSHTARHRPLRELITAHATKYGVPQHLVRRVIAAESGYNAKARNGPYVGLMQIALATARGLGYRGDATGLTDPDTNLKYGVAYLANAYHVAGKDEDRAVQLYRSGYYYAAKRKGMLGELIAAR